MKIRLKELLKEKGISVYLLSKMTGINEYNLGKIVHNKTSSIRFDTLDLICYHLDIDIGDILEPELPHDCKNIP